MSTLLLYCDMFRNKLFVLSSGILDLQYRPLVVICIVFAAMLVASSVTCILLYRALRSSETEKIRYMGNISMLKVKLEDLSAEYAANEARAAVVERLGVLDMYAVSIISTKFSESDAYACLNTMMSDVNGFLESTRQCFQFVRPRFMDYLSGQGLTERETGICCLYCMGLNGSEILGYLNLPSFYNVSASIRRKLNVVRKINLDTYLREKMREFDSVAFNIDIVSLMGVKWLYDSVLRGNNLF